MPINISIHALREEGDLGLRYEGDNAKVFLSTPSARRATLVYGRQRRGKLISIHALREEGDGAYARVGLCYTHISIHALREEGDSKNREKTPCFCLIIHLPAQIAKRCL